MAPERPSGVLGSILKGILRGMNTNKQTRLRRLCVGAAAAGGIAASMLGLASGTAQAAPHQAPMSHHHWCPGDQWNPGWGPYQNWNNCRDWDGNYGPAGYNAPPPWGAADAAATAVGAVGPGRLEPGSE